MIMNIDENIKQEIDIQIMITIIHIIMIIIMIISMMINYITYFPHTLMNMSIEYVLKFLINTCKCFS
jgi:hypothetical protein